MSSSEASDDSDDEGAGDEPEVEVRMIDFANTSCYVEGGDPVPEGVDLEKPDTGYILGLESLAHFLRKLMDELDAAAPLAPQ